MQISDFIGIATFALSILGLVYALGQQSAKLQVAEKNINDLAGMQRDIDKRLDKQSVFAVRVDQRIVSLEERVFGDETVARMRSTD